MSLISIKHRQVFLVLCFLMVSADITLAADQQSALTLSLAVQRMLEKHPTLKQQEFTKESLVFKLKAAELRPSTELEIELDSFGGSGVFDGTDSSEGLVALSSVIEFGGQRQARSDFVSNELGNYAIQREIEKLDLLASLTEAFIQGLSIQESMGLAEQHLALLKNVFMTVKKRVDRGIASEADLMQAKVALAMAENNLESLEQEFARQKVFLSSFWRKRNPDFDLVKGELFELGQGKSFAALFAEAEQAPSIQLLARKERFAEAKVALEKSSNRPDVAWRIGVKNMRDVDESALVAGVSVPLFSKSRNRPNLAIAQLERERFSLEKEQALLEFHRRLFELYSLRIQHIDTVERLKTEVIPSLEVALEATKLGYINGRYRFLELVNAQEQLIEARKMKIDSATQALIYQARIEQLSAVALGNNLSDKNQEQK